MPTSSPLKCETFKSSQSSITILLFSIFPLVLFLRRGKVCCDSRGEQHTHVPNQSTAANALLYISILICITSGAVRSVREKNFFRVVSSSPERASDLHISRADRKLKFLPCTHTMPFFMWNLTHLCGPELHQYGLYLRVLVDPLLLQEPPVGMKPRTRPRVFSQTRWGQKVPQSPSNTLSCPLLLCYTDKHRKVSEQVSHRRNVNSWTRSERQ